MGNDTNDPILPTPKTEAAKQAQRNFEHLVEKQLKQEEQIAFNILVWGMAPDGDAPIARKRREIRDQLIIEVHQI